MPAEEGEEVEEEEEEAEEKEPPSDGEMGPDLEEDMLDLSNIGKTIDGEGYAFFQLDCVNKEVEGKKVGKIDLISEYEHLRQIDMSKNAIRDVTPLGALSFVLTLDLSSNKIDSLEPWGLDAFAHLLHLDISGNRLEALPPIGFPALRTANFAANRITTCEAFTGHRSLETLNLSENRLEASLSGVGNMPKVHTLNLANQKPGLSKLEGMVELQGLRSLDLSHNKLESLDGPWKEAKELATLNVSNNKIATTKGLEPMGKIINLKSVLMEENPLNEEDGVNIRTEVIIVHFTIASINDEEVTEEERDEAKGVNEQRIEDERQRRLAEEEERRLAEEAAEAERIEQERLEAERLEAERIENERLAAEKAEEERLAAEAAAAEAGEAAEGEGEGAEAAGEGAPDEAAAS